MSLKLWMTEEIQSDVSQKYAIARMEIEPALNSVVDPTDYGALKKWYFMAIFLDDDDPNFPEVKKYRKKAQDFEFRLKIDHAAFKAADDLGKRKLIVAALLRSIDEMRKLVPKGIDYARLEHLRGKLPRIDLRDGGDSLGSTPGVGDSLGSTSQA